MKLLHHHLRAAYLLAAASWCTTLWSSSFIYDIADEDHLPLASFLTSTCFLLVPSVSATGMARHTKNKNERARGGEDEDQDRDDLTAAARTTHEDPSLWSPPGGKDVHEDLEVVKVPAATFISKRTQKKHQKETWFQKLQKTFTATVITMRDKCGENSISGPPYDEIELLPPAPRPGKDVLARTAPSERINFLQDREEIFSLFFPADPVPVKNQPHAKLFLGVMPMIWGDHLTEREGQSFFSEVGMWDSFLSKDGDGERKNRLCRPFFEYNLLIRENIGMFVSFNNMQTETAYLPWGKYHQDFYGEFSTRTPTTTTSSSASNKQQDLDLQHSEHLLCTPETKLQPRDITYGMHAAPEAFFYGPRQRHFKQHQFCQYDHYPLTLDQLHRAADSIFQALNDNRNTYVHCKAGMTRSGMGVIAFLLKHATCALGGVNSRSPTLAEAVAYVTTMRPVSNVAGKEEQLRRLVEFEKDVASAKNSAASEQEDGHKWRMAISCDGHFRFLEVKGVDVLFYSKKNYAYKFYDYQNDHGVDKRFVERGKMKLYRLILRLLTKPPMTGWRSSDVDPSAFPDADEERNLKKRIDKAVANDPRKLPWRMEVSESKLTKSKNLRCEKSLPGRPTVCSRRMTNFPRPGSESVMRFRAKVLSSVMLISSPILDPCQDYNPPSLHPLQESRFLCSILCITNFFDFVDFDPDTSIWRLASVLRGTLRKNIAVAKKTGNFFTRRFEKKHDSSAAAPQQEEKIDWKLGVFARVMVEEKQKQATSLASTSTSAGGGVKSEVEDALVANDSTTLDDRSTTVGSEDDGRSTTSSTGRGAGPDEAEQEDETRSDALAAVVDEVVHEGQQDHIKDDISANKAPGPDLEVAAREVDQIKKTNTKHGELYDLLDAANTDFPDEHMKVLAHHQHENNFLAHHENFQTLLDPHLLQPAVYHDSSSTASRDATNHVEPTGGTEPKISIYNLHIQLKLPTEEEDPTDTSTTSTSHDTVAAQDEASHGHEKFLEMTAAQLYNLIFAVFCAKMFPRPQSQDGKFFLPGPQFLHHLIMLVGAVRNRNLLDKSASFIGCCA
ncbi:unnamed protein product [Amoebophrya sp. A120]|nr:unnamed protein product [Amoebophrya sp. A120]|eukprot:GSA120T00004688001.1